MATYIITGTSRGLGEALANQLIKPGNTLICLSRKRNTELVKRAHNAGVTLAYYECDLSQAVDLENVAEQILQDHSFGDSGKMVLINNAGVVEPIVRIGQVGVEDLVKNVQVNLIAPMLLNNWFLGTFAHHKGEKQIVNVSSGAATKPYDGWAAYCSTKAGLDMLTRTMAIEQQRLENPAVILSFSPGIMDTDMQGQIRESEEGHFSNVETFRGFKEKGLLRSVDSVASKLLNLLDGDVESGRIYSIHELIED